MTFIFHMGLIIYFIGFNYYFIGFNYYFAKWSNADNNTNSWSVNF